MAYHHINPIKGFTDLEQRYKHTRPVHRRVEGGVKKEDNIRPIDPTRASWWNRIVKFSDTHYGVLTDDAFTWTGNKKYKQDLETMLANSCYRIELKGSQEIMTLSVRQRSVVADHTMIKLLIPPAMRLNTANKQSIIRYLAYDYGIRRSTSTKVGISASFMRKAGTDDNWVFCGEELVRKQVKRIDADSKKPYTQGIAAFKDWMQVPMMLHRDQSLQLALSKDWQARGAARQAQPMYVMEWFNTYTNKVPTNLFGDEHAWAWRNSAHSDDPMIGGDMGEELVKDTLREMLASFGTGEPEPMYEELAMTIAGYFSFNVDDDNVRSHSPELTNGRLNAFINKYAGFYKIVEQD